MDLLVLEGDAEALKREAAQFVSWDVNERQAFDLEMLLSGAFAPLRGYLGRADCERVMEEMRLQDGSIWPLPVTLDVSEEFAAKVESGQAIALRDAEGVLLAVMQVQDKWVPDRLQQAQAVYGTSDEAHPGVHALLRRTHPACLGGPLRGVQLPVHYDFTYMRLSPREVRREFAKRGWRRVAAFLTRNPLHRLQFETTTRGARAADASLLVLPIVGPTQPGDIDFYTRLRCWEEGMRRYPEHHALLCALPLAMRLAGPREAALQAIVARNYGCTPRDHRPLAGRRRARRRGKGVLPFRVGEGVAAALAG